MITIHQQNTVFVCTQSHYIKILETPTACFEP